MGKNCAGRFKMPQLFHGRNMGTTNTTKDITRLVKVLLAMADIRMEAAVSVSPAVNHMRRAYRTPCPAVMG